MKWRFKYKYPLIGKTTLTWIHCTLRNCYENRSSQCFNTVPDTCTNSQTYIPQVLLHKFYSPSTRTI